MTVRQHSAALLFCTGLASSFSGCWQESPEVKLQRQMIEGTARVKALSAAGDKDAAIAVLREMAAIDPEHPKIYNEAAKLFLTPRPTRWDRAAALMDSLGSDGPGRRFGEGNMAARRGRNEEAERLFNLTIEAYSARDHAAGQASSYQMLGITLRNAKRHDDAEAALREAIPLFDRVGDLLGRATTLSEMGKIELARGDLEAALELQHRAQKIRERTTDLDAQGRGFVALGRTLREMDRTEQALDAFEEALARYRELGDQLRVYTYLRDVANIEMDLGDWRRSVSRHAEAAQLAQEMGDGVRRAQALDRQAGALLYAGRHLEAAELLPEAIASCVEAGDRGCEAEARLSLSSVRRRLRRFAAAAESARRALALAQEIDDWRLEARVLTNLASAEASSGDLARALVTQNAALDLIGNDGELDEDRIVALNNQGINYLALGNLDRAERYLREAIEAAEAKTRWFKHRARALTNLGAVLLDRGDADAALVRQREALEVWQSVDDPVKEAWCRLMVAQTLLQMERPDEALATLADAGRAFESAQDVVGRVFSLRLEGEILRGRGDLEKAVTLLRRAMALSDEYGLIEDQWLLNAGLAAALEASGDLDEAAREYDVAIERLESSRATLAVDLDRTRFLSSHADVYDAALALQLRRETDPAASGAFVMAERTKARAVLELLAESGAALRGALPPELIRRERELIDDLRAAVWRLADSPSVENRGTVDRAEQAIQRFAIEARRLAPAYSQIAYPSAVTLDEVRRDVLADGEVLLSYSIGEHGAWLWVVTRERARVHRLPDPSSIEARVRDFLDREGRAAMRFDGGDRDTVAELTSSLIPVELPKGARLLVAPDGPLHHLPFGALRRDGRYLVEDHPVVVLPSATVLKLMRGGGGRIAPGGFLGVGNPRASAAEFEDLPHAARALDRIADAFPADARLVLSADSAHLAAFKEADPGRFRYVHFATHGWLDPSDSRRFGLRMTRGPEPESGFLYLDDIFTLDLSAELVVLAACRSGAADLLRGEGLVRVVSAFLYAGARSMVVSLWDVNDESAAVFMERFYRELAGGHAVPEALQRTKVSFLGSDRPTWREPYHWAPFVLMGDPRTEANRD